MCLESTVRKRVTKGQGVSGNRGIILLVEKSENHVFDMGALEWPLCLIERQNAFFSHLSHGPTEMEKLLEPKIKLPFRPHLHSQRVTVSFRGILVIKFAIILIINIDKEK